jgi:hypothetical protein
MRALKPSLIKAVGSAPSVARRLFNVHSLAYRICWLFVANRPWVQLPRRGLACCDRRSYSMGSAKIELTAGKSPR